MSQVKRKHISYETTGSITYHTSDDISFPDSRFRELCVKKWLLDTQQQLGEGGYAEVYVVIDSTKPNKASQLLKEKYIVKVMDITGDEYTYQNEYSVMKQLQQKYIENLIPVKIAPFVYDAFKCENEDETLEGYIIAERMTQDLYSMLANFKHRMLVSMKPGVTNQLLDYLKHEIEIKVIYLLQCGIIHKDLHCGNVLVKGTVHDSLVDIEVFLNDFGEVGTFDPEHTKDRQLQHKFSYCMKKIDYQFDLFYEQLITQEREEKLDCPTGKCIKTQVTPIKSSRKD